MIPLQIITMATTVMNIKFDILQKYENNVKTTLAY